MAFWFAVLTADAPPGPPKPPTTPRAGGGDAAVEAWVKRLQGRHAR